MTQSDKHQYDISDLPGGLLYKLGAKTDIGAWWQFITWFIVVVISSVHVVLFAQPAIDATLLFMIFLSAALFAIGPKIRDNLYPHSTTAFANKNKLQALQKDEMISCVPPCILNNESRDSCIKGFYFLLNDLSIRIFDYSYEIGDIKSPERYNFAVAAIPLSKEYPHIFLDSKANGRSYKYAGSQQVKLEGDFNKYFRFLIPKGSQEGALTILSPDVMQTIVAQAKKYDLEIDGKFAFIVTPGFAFTKEVTQGLFAVSGALAKELTELDRTWQPVYLRGTNRFRLKKSTLGITIAFCLVAALFAFVCYSFLVAVSAK